MLCSPILMGIIPALPYTLAVVHFGKFLDVAMAGKAASMEGMLKPNRCVG